MSSSEAPRPSDAGHEPLDDGPTASLWAVDSVQRQAVEAAEFAIERLLDLAGRTPPPGPGPAGDGPAGPDPAGPDPAGPGPAGDGAADGGATADPTAADAFLLARATMVRSVDLVLDLVRETFDAYADLAETAFRSRAGGHDGAGAAAPVTLVVDGGPVARGRFWLHNTTGAPTAPEHPRVTDLWSVGGGVIAGSSATVAPSPLPAVPPGGSMEATLAVDVGGAEPGRYVGHVLTSHGALALTVDVGG